MEWTGKSTSNNHNIDETGQMRTENTGTIMHRSTKLFNNEQLNRMMKTNQQPS